MYTQYDKLYQYKQPRWDNIDYSSLKMINKKCLEPYTAKYNIKHGCFISKTKQNIISELNFIRIIDPGSTVCESKNIILLLILSNPTHSQLRQRIRNIYANFSYGDLVVQHLFLMGKVGNKKLQFMIMNESLKYNDILQSSFLDSYSNITYATMMGFKWVLDYCAHAKYIIRTEDDIYLDIIQVILYLKKFEVEHGDFMQKNWNVLKPKAKLFTDHHYHQIDPKPREYFDYVLEDSKLSDDLLQLLRKRNTVGQTKNDTCNIQNFDMLNIDPKFKKEFLKKFNDNSIFYDIIFCPMYINSQPVRDPRMKYYINISEYPSPYFPPYCHGWFYALKPPLVFKLYHAFFTQKHTHLEDVHITGTLALVPGVLLININNRLKISHNPYEQWIYPSVMEFNLQNNLF